MEGLLVLFVIIGLVSKIGKKKKKEQDRRRQAGFTEAAALPVESINLSAAKKAAELFEMAEDEAEQIKIPYTKEEWSKFLKENAPEKKKETRSGVQKAVLRSADSSLISEMDAVPPARPDMEAAEGQEFEKLHPQRLTAERLRPAEHHSEGESHKEHAAHKARIAQEEARIHRERIEIQELRSMNLKKLRSAVIMSEVLGKPVALRGRR